MAASYIFHGSIKPGDGMPLSLSSPDERIRHGKAVSVFPWTSCNHNNLFAHMFHSHYAFFTVLTLMSIHIMIVTNISTNASTRIQM